MMIIDMWRKKAIKCVGDAPSCIRVIDAMCARSGNSGDVRGWFSASYSQMAKESDTSRSTFLTTIGALKSCGLLSILSGRHMKGQPNKYKLNFDNL